MRHSDKAKLWVYNKETGSVSRKTLTYQEATHETWFQDNKHHTYDPFYVDASKQFLINKVLNNLGQELQQTLERSRKLVKRMERLRKKD